MTTVMTHDTMFPAGTAQRSDRRPRATVFASAVQLLFALLPAPAGVVFSLAEGGAWAVVGGTLFALAVPLWLTGAVGTWRGSARGYRIGVGMLLAMTAFGVYKIAWVHEQVSWGFEVVTLLALWAQLSRSTRAWVRR